MAGWSETDLELFQWVGGDRAALGGGGKDCEVDVLHLLGERGRALLGQFTSPWMGCEPASEPAPQRFSVGRRTRKGAPAVGPERLLSLGLSS
ncbi:MAG: hypothetical protein QOH86_1945 [Sphingomonadales bacterium]|nr:hypothetical protein [Sphingomonadales bacterium]